METGFGQVGGHPQRDKRTHIEAMDQHGRMWENVLDIAAKPKPGPVSLWKPKGWDAPLLPDQKYIRWHPDNMFRIEIDYRSWKIDLRAARNDWENLLHKTAGEMSPQDAGASLVGGSKDTDYRDASPALLRSVGPKPQAVEPVIAAEQGEPWVLGKSNRVNVRLKAFFPDPVEDTIDFTAEDNYLDIEEEHDPEGVGRQSGRPMTWNDFQKDAKRRGLTQVEAAAAWNAQKQVA